MPVTAEFLFETPQRELAPVLCDLYRRAESVRIVTGFATRSGIEHLRAEIVAAPQKLRHFVLGAATYQAFVAVDELIAAGVPADRIFVDLGLSRSTGRVAFEKFHPMLHSKIYLFTMPAGLSVAVVGSHNVTGFALGGDNGEAATIVTGRTDDPEMKKVYDHVEAARSGAVRYSPDMKAGYAWWTREFLDGFRIFASDLPRDADNHPTVLVLLHRPAQGVPRPGHHIYFELPEATSRGIDSIKPPVHLLFFDTRPATPADALAMQPTVALRCRVSEIDVDQRTNRLTTEWRIPDLAQPDLLFVGGPFDPTPPPGMRQVRIAVEDTLFERYEYLFDSEKQVWIPEFDQKSVSKPIGKKTDDFDLKKATTREAGPWYRVLRLRPQRMGEKEEVRAAMQESAPERGTFVLFSIRRRSATSQSG